MNAKLLLIAVSAAALTSCSSIYKTGQTPDDVYYSPARVVGGGDQVRREQERDDDYYAPDSRAIRMGIVDPRWRSLDLMYGYNPYFSPYSYSYNYFDPYLSYPGFTHGGYFGGFYGGGGYYFNPYYWPYPVYNPIFVGGVKNPVVTTPRMNNLKTYNNVAGYTNYPNARTRANVTRGYQNSNESRVGRTVRRSFNVDNGNNNNNNNRSYTPQQNNNNSTPSRSYSAPSSPAPAGPITRPGRN